MNTVHGNIEKAWQNPFSEMGICHAFQVISRSLFLSNLAGVVLRIFEQYHEQDGDN